MERNPISLSRDLVLFLILAMKVLPQEWIYELDSDYQIKKTKLLSVINNLIAEGFIKRKQNISPTKFLYLTKKGFERANKNRLITYKYGSWNKAKKRISSINQDHHYIIFRFLIDYFTNFKKVSRIYTDYDRDCKLEYKTLGKIMFVKPDLIIRPIENDATEIIALEADTNRETQRKLFDKLLKYILMAFHQGEIDTVEKIILYFSFGSKERNKKTFSLEEGKLGRFFSEVNTFLSTKVKTRIMIKDVLRVFRKNKLTIKSGVYSKGFENYRTVDMLNLIYKENKNWKKL